MTVTRITKTDGTVAEIHADPGDGMPPEHLIQGGAGYPGAHTFVWRKLDIDGERKWRLVEAIGWKHD